MKRGVGSNERTGIESNKCPVVDDGVVWKVGVLLYSETHIRFVVPVGGRWQVQVVESPLQDVVAVNAELIRVAGTARYYREGIQRGIQCVANNSGECCVVGCVGKIYEVL